MKTDIQISNECKITDIRNIGNKIGLSEGKLELYGKYKAKIDISQIKGKESGKLVLVTSVNPTPFGEGKTTMSIGITDALCLLGKNSIVALREPSLGPVFGIKGGAAGGGYSQVVPMEDINLHFTGDIHAITSANNLICALIDNHIYQGNELNINPLLKSVLILPFPLKSVFPNVIKEASAEISFSERFSPISFDFNFNVGILADVIFMFPLYAGDNNLPEKVISALTAAFEPLNVGTDIDIC